MSLIGVAHMNKVKLGLAALTLTVSSTVLSESSLGTCNSPSPNVLDDKNKIMASCDSAVIALKSDEKGEKEYRNSLYEKLAKMLAVQTTQTLHDLGATSDFFEQNNEQFLLDSQVQTSCRFQVFAELEKKCGDKDLDQEGRERIKILTEAFGQIDNYKSTGLLDSLLHIYGSNKYGSGFDKEQSNVCPMQSNSTALSTQLTSEASQGIISVLTSADEKSKEYQYAKFPQLAMINEAEKYHPGFKAKFEKYIKGFKEGKDDPKKFLQTFFFDSQNKKSLSAGVANRCSQMQKSISSFVCHPLKNLASHDPLISRKLFSNYDPTIDFSEQRSKVKADPNAFKTYAYLCQTQKEAKSSVVLAKDIERVQPKINYCHKLKSEEDNTVDNYYRCFNEGITQTDRYLDDEKTLKFCQRFSCISEDVKNTPSCKAGGPLASKDLAELKLSEEGIESQISYLTSLEKHKQNKQNFIAYMDAVSTGKPIDENIKKNISEFDMNMFGAESMAKLIGLPPTQQSIAMVSTHMTASGIKPASSEEINRIVNRSNFDDAVAAMDKANSQNNTVINNNYNQTVASNDYGYQAPVNRFDSVEPKYEKAKKDEQKNANSTFFGTGDLNDIKKSETEQMIKDLKTLMDANKNDKAVENESSGPVQTNSVKSDVSRSLENEMNAWANRLATREAQLRDREGIANMREAEYWQKREQLRSREAELEAREAELKKKREPASAPAAVATASKSTSSAALQETKTARLKLDQDLSATPAGLTVTPERLEKLDKNDLKENKVNIEEPFVISVRLKSKLVHVRVAKFKNGNRTYLAPYLNEDNMEVREAILKSPIFSEFRYFLEQKEMAYTPVKKIKK